MVLFKKIISSPHQLVGRQNGKRVVPLQVFHDRLTVPTGQEPRIQDYRDPRVSLGPDEAANSLPEVVGHVCCGNATLNVARAVGTG